MARQLPIDHPPVRGFSNGDVMTADKSLWKDITRWSLAGFFVLSAHVAGAYVMHAVQSEDIKDGEAPAAIMMELDPMPQAPELENDAAAAVAETTPDPQLAEAEPEKPVEKNEQETPKPEEITPEEPVKQPEEIVTHKPVEEVTPQVPEVAKPAVELPKPVVAPKLIEKSKPVEPKIEKPNPVKQKTKPKPKQAQKAESSQKAAAPQVVAKDSQRVAGNANRQSDVSAGVTTAKWSSKLQAHLERKKRYLQRSLGRNNNASVMMNFVIDPAGNVLSVRVVGSSGNPKLDQKAVDMLKRASPVPAPPPAIAKARLPVTLPLRFE